MVVAAAFAVFVLLREPLGEAGAAATVSALTALLLAIAAAVAALLAKAYRDRHPPEPTLVERVAELVREKPLVSAGAALAAGLMALKNHAAAPRPSPPPSSAPRPKDPRRR